MTTVMRGLPATLTVEWREYAGGPMAEVTAVEIGVASLSAGAIALASTTIGVSTPATGVNAYTWTPADDLPVGQYLVSWQALDADSELVTATEVVQVSEGGQLGGPYSTRAKLKKRMGIPDATTAQDDEVDRALLSASSAINRWCGRQFGQATEASVRTFLADASGVDIADAWSLDGITVAGSALDTTTWTALPLDGVRDGVPGWPYERLERTWGDHPIYHSVYPIGRAVLVSALWGWASVPADIESACLMLAADTLKSKDAPFGVAGFGDYAIRVRANPKVQELLMPYVREPLKVAS
jgi:hypothetical protein